MKIEKLEVLKRATRAGAPLGWPCGVFLSGKIKNLSIYLSSLTQELVFLADLYKPTGTFTLQTMFTAGHKIV